ncbi:MAG: aa3-type cytochrome c oxidase subunit IV [Phenylobacterium zucineum]|nr:MAG: aa3-type cytochrome c oxidase subunit IV [Phenylobacterium zucineum]
MASEYHRGEMDIQEQVATFRMFNGLTKWGSLALAALMILLVLWFCTPTGFLGAAASAFIVTVIGVVVLKEKPDASH